MFQIFPAIDLRGGHVVRLEQGRAEAETIYGSNPAQVAEGFRLAGATHLHVVDLDGAFAGESRNLPLVRSIAQAGPPFLQVGGGLRSEAAIGEALKAGAHRAVVGTRACESLSFVRAVVEAFGTDRIAIGIDARDGIVSTRGWTAPSKWTAHELAQAVVAQGVRTLIYTDIATDGMFTGPNIAALRALTGAVPGVEIIASGGVASLDHVRALAHMGGSIRGVIIGKALYDGKLQLRDALDAVRT